MSDNTEYYFNIAPIGNNFSVNGYNFTTQNHHILSTEAFRRSPFMQALQANGQSGWAA